MKPLVVIALVLMAGQCLAQVALESALEGFDDNPAVPSGPGNDPNGSHPQSGTGLDDILAGFDETWPSDGTPTGSAGTSPASDRLRFGGSIRQEFIYNVSHKPPPPGGTDHRGLSSARLRIDLELDANLDSGHRARLTGSLLVDPARKDTKGQPGGSTWRDAVLGEAFIQMSLDDSADLALGRQVVVWGRADQFRVTDIINPVDNRTPGMTDIRDLRLPLTMARLDLYNGPWNASLILVPERRFDEVPEPVSDYNLSGQAPPPREYPAGRFGKPDIALSLTGTFSGWDMSLYTARYFSRSGHLHMTGDGPGRRHERQYMLGAAANLVSGNWLFKTEAAMVGDIRYSALPDRRFRRVTLLAGFEYSGLPFTTLAAEATASRILDYDDQLTEVPDNRRENETAFGFRIARTFLNESLELSAAGIANGPISDNGGLMRIQARYSTSDSTEMFAGALLYWPGDHLPFSHWADNDRIFAGIGYHF